MCLQVALCPTFLLHETSPWILMTLLKKLARDPLVHFLLIGVLIYGAYGLFEGDSAEEDVRTITVTEGEIRALTDQWTRVWSRPPTESEISGTLRSYVRTRILYREAVAMGLDSNDQVIERRLAQKVELLSRGLVTPKPPGDEVLASWYAENGEPFREPDTYTITQLFFDPDRRDDAVTDAESALSQLQILEGMPEDITRYGENSILGRYYSGRDELELRKLFGSGFVDQIVRLEPGSWHGPVLSGYGVHLVYVHDVVKPQALALEDIREKVQEAWMLEQVDELSALFIDELIARYEVVVEEAQVPMTVPPKRTGE
jgi:peptidyl-prolyl cis-trans isomerase C